MLRCERDLEVVGEAGSGQEALELCRQLRPDLVLMDARMPDTDGFAATRAIKEESPTTTVLVVSTYENPDYLLEAITAGAAGYVLKGTNRQRFLSAIRRVLRGESALNQELAMRLLRRLTKEGTHKTQSAPKLTKKGGQPTPEPLTGRELEVLELLARGATNPQIAQALGISVHTVKTHVEHIIGKIKASDRTQAVVRALELGLLAAQEEKEE